MNKISQEQYHNFIYLWIIKDEMFKNCRMGKAFILYCESVNVIINDDYLYNMENDERILSLMDDYIDQDNDCFYSKENEWN